MLVAVALFAIASALAFGGLDALTRARSQLDAENERLGRLQFAIGLIERDLRGVAARAVRDGYGAPQAALVGTRDRLEFSRHGLSNALALPRSTIERVGYRLHEGSLQRQRYAVLDRTAAARPSEDRLLDQVETLEFAYLADDGRELAQWPPPRAPDDAPPRAVAVTLTLPDYGELRRVLELPEAPAP
jgi:general secretion pathway protein J